MSQISKGLLGVVAISLTFGAVQLASGRDLSGVKLAASVLSPASETGINRAAKADRIPGVLSAFRTQTISLRLDNLSGTSVLVRIPVAREAESEARNRPSAPSFIKSGDRKTAIACEPSVSVLTEVAKQLQPGRCVT